MPNLKKYSVLQENIFTFYDLKNTHVFKNNM